MTDLVDEFAAYVRDIFQNAPADERDRKLKVVLTSLAGSAVRQAAQTMLAIDVDASAWSDEQLAENLLKHVAFRSTKNDMMPAHCMMLEAGRRLGRQNSQHDPALKNGPMT